MRPAATRPDAARVPSTLYGAFELGNTEWKLAMNTPDRSGAPVRTLPARELAVLEAELLRAKAHFGVPAGAAVVSCYEAARDAFWLHRYPASRDIANAVVDWSSIEALPWRLDRWRLIGAGMRADRRVHGSGALSSPGWDSSAAS